jgi:hypothetical protein
LIDVIENKLGDYQMGFHPNRSTNDNIFIVRQIFEKCHEHNIDLYNIFLDNTQAFDSVNRNKIIECLKRYGIPIKIRLFGLTHINTTARVKINNKLSEEFRLESGVKQGNPLFCNSVQYSYRQCVKTDGLKRKYFNMVKTMFCTC